MRDYPALDEKAPLNMKHEQDPPKFEMIEEALGQTAETVQGLVKSYPDAIVLADLNGHITMINQRTADLFGINTSEESISMHAFERFAEKDRQRALANMLRILQTGKAADSEYTFQRMEGTPFLGELRVSLIADEDGKPSAYIGFLRNVEKRGLSRERIERLNQLKGDLLWKRRREEKLKLVTDGVVEIFDADFARIWLTMPGDRCDTGCMHADVKEGPHVCQHRDRCLHLMASSGRYTHTNGKVHRRVPFGCYKIGRVAAGKESGFITNDVTSDPRVHHHDWAKKHGLVSFAGYRLVTSTGDPIGVLALFSKHEMGPEEEILIETIARTTSDVIQTLKAEEEVLRNEAKYRTLFEAAGDAIFLAEVREGGLFFKDCNRRALQMFGAAPEQILGKTPFDFSPAVQANGRSSKAEASSKIHQAINGTPGAFEWRHSRLDGTVFDAEVNLNHIDLGEGIYVLGVVRDVSDRKKAEASLQASEARYRSLIENMPIGLYRKIPGPNGRFVMANPAIAKMHGFDSVEEFLNYPVADLYVNTEELEAFSHELLTKGSAMSQELRLKKKDGTRLWGAVTARMSRDSSENTQHFDGIIEDITKRKLAQEAQQESEERYRLLAENATDVIWTMDMNMRFTYVSPSVERLRGFSVEEALSEKIEDVLTPLSLEIAMKIFEEEMAIEQEEHKVLFRPRTLQLEQKCKDGSTVWTELKVSFIRDPDNRAVGLLGITRDITERRQKDEALRHSEERYRLLVENSIDAIFIAQDGMMKFVNHASSELTGFSKEAMLQIPFMNLVYPEDRSRVLSTHTKRLKGEEVPNTHMFRIVKNNGDVLWVEVGGVGIQWEGKPATINFVRDITEKKRLENQLRETQKMEAIGTLAGGIAHDFNNLLAVISGYTELSLVRNPKDGRQQSYLEEILKAGIRAKDLVNQILTFSRQHDHELKYLDVVDIIKEAINFLRASLPTTIDISHDIRVESGVVLGDSSQIHQVLMNLGTNAGYAMRERGGLLQVELHEVNLDRTDVTRYPGIEAGTYLKLTVRDKGHGIEKKIMDRIFDPFFTTKGPCEGTGMGLSVVHGIIKNHNGAVSVDSETGKGTAFHVLLPKIDGEVSTDEKQPAQQMKEKVRILLVDDEKSLLYLGQQQLEHMGHEVVTRISSVEALEVFRAQPNGFDIVITDLTMPNMTGLELSNELMGIRDDIPILLCTGFSEAINQEKAEEVGIREILMKPVMMSALEEAIQRIRVQNGQEESVPRAKGNSFSCSETDEQKQERM